MIIAAIPVVITIKNKDDLTDNILYFIIVFLSSIAFAVFLGFDIWFFTVSKKDSCENIRCFSDGLLFCVAFLACIVMIFSGAYMAYKCYNKDFEIMMQNSTIEYERSNKVERKLN